MKILYTVIGNHFEGNFVVLQIAVEQVTKRSLDVMEAVKDLGGFMQQMKVEASENRNPDKVRIPRDEWNKGGYNLGDVISVDITNGGD
jgi:hypothetical protein